MKTTIMVVIEKYMEREVVREYLSEDMTFETRLRN